ncbi:hypothetical protein N665_0201s0163 [Sinapis alba]|nr:hypothetical protein N665_0201s0163 [Sinapis alba]KAF8101851.1 hypothetical protein N665_0201s0163 [Sinapis alba]
MSMQNGSKRTSPSIIARLMGLDVLPPPHREPNHVENQQRRTIPSDKARGKQAYSEESLWKGSMDEKRFKDVFEVLDADEGKSSTSLYQRRRVNANNLTEAEIAFIRHKFMEAKRLSTDEKLRYSKEFNETLEALDSNKDLLLKFLRQPDSLFTKHLPGLQSIAPKPQCIQATTLKREDREFSGKSHRSPQWHCDGVDLSKQQWKKRSGLKPTEIVVLKPNLGKPQTCARTLPSHSSSCDEAREDLRLPCTSSNQESKSFGSSKGNEDVFLLRNKSRDSREIARIVSRQLKASGGNESSINFDMSRFRGYTGDESSSGSDSSRARTDFSRKNHRRSLSSRSPESVSKEAMRRMLERWKLAHSSEKEIEIRRRNTLADMLATSDREARAASFSRTTFEEGVSTRYESNVGQSELQDPIGISSRDGWKDTGRRNFSKSRTIMHKDRTCSHTIVLPKKLTNNSRFSDNSSSEINRPSSRKSLKTQSSLSVHADSDTESGSDYEDAKSSPSLEPLDLSAVTHHPQESAEEGDQPSPQTSLQDEFPSNSDCFESISADLQGLRMKLQLLKRESDTYTEGDMLVSSDEEESSSIVTDETMIIPELVENWKSLYLADILANSRFSDLNPTSFMASWHSSESPLDPSLFDDLEKKCSGLKTSTRVERKFVFDRINSEILEFFEQFTDLRPTKINPKWDISRIHETMHELLTRKHMKDDRDTKEELQLPSLENGVEVIGKEIEEMLTEELIAELVVIRDCSRKVT